MKYLTKRIIYAIIVSIALSSFWGLVRTNIAYGWDNNYNPAGTCTALAAIPYTNIFNATNEEIFTFDQYITQASSGVQNANLSWDYMFGVGTNSMILVGNSNGEHRLYYEKNTNSSETILIKNDKIEFPDDTYSSPVVIGDSNGQLEETMWYFTTIPTLQNNGNNFDLNQASQVTCIHKVDNVSYEDNYNGAIFNSYQDEVYYNTTCDTFDISCQIGRIFTGISNTFVSVGQAIVNGIAALFIPDSETISQYFDDIKASFNDQIGFLAYPFTFLIDLFNNIDTSNCSPNCDVTFAGTLFGSQVTFDADALETAYPPLWFWLTSFVRASIVVALAIALYKKYMKVVKH